MEIGNLRLSYLTDTIWKLKPEVLEVLKKITLSGNIDKQSFFNREEKETALSSIDSKGSVAVLNISGVLMNKASWFDSLFGFASTQTIRQEFKKLSSNPDIKRIVLYIDSPGGSTQGIQELSNDIYTARKQKEIIAFTDGLMCSAAYEIGAAAEYIVAEPTAIIANIGTYQIIKKQKDSNFEYHILQAGSKKVFGNSITPMTDEEKEYFSEKIKLSNDRFLKSVALCRNSSFDEVKNLEGAYFEAQDAPKWLYDEIGSFNCTLL